MDVVGGLGRALAGGVETIGTGLTSGLRTIGGLVTGDDEPDQKSLQVAEWVCRASSIAVCHAMAPLWSLSTVFSAEDWPPPPVINLASGEVQEFIANLNQMPIHQVIQSVAGNPFLSTLCIALLAARLFFAEMNGTTTVDFSQLAREFLPQGAGREAVPPRPVSDREIQRKHPWALDRLGGPTSSNLLERRNIRTAHFNQEFNKQRLRLLYWFIFATVRLRYFPTHPFLFHVLGAWATHHQWVSDRRQLRELLVTGCSPRTYICKYIRFITSTPRSCLVDASMRRIVTKQTEDTQIAPASPAAAAAGAPGGAGGGGGEELQWENDDNRFLIDSYVPFPFRLVPLLVQALESITVGRRVDEDHLGVVAPMMFDAVVASIKTFQRDPYQSRGRLLNLVSWMLGWFRRVHTSPSMRQTLCDLFRAVKPLFVYSRPIGNTAEWVKEELRCTVPYQLFPDPSLRAQYFFHVKEERTKATRRELHVLCNLDTRRIHKLLQMELGRLSFARSEKLKQPKTVIDPTELDDDKDTIGVKANLVLNLIDDIDPEILTDEEKASVEELPKQCLAHFWQDCCQILETVPADAVNDEDDGIQIKAKVDRALTELVRSSMLTDDRWEKDSEESNHADEDFEPSDPPRDARYDSREVEYKYDLLIGDHRSPMTRHPAPAMPIPDLHFLTVRFEPCEKLLASAVDDATGCHVTEWLATLQEIVDREAASTPAQDTKNPIRNRTRLDIVLIGGTISFHRLVTAYAILAYSSPAFLERDLRVYALPFGTCNIAAKYLAREDLWYYNMVYAPLAPGGLEDDDTVFAEVSQGTSQRNAPAMSPLARKQSSISTPGLGVADVLVKIQQLSDPTSGMKYSTGTDNTPDAHGVLLRQCLTNYCTNAIFGKPVRIWQVELYGRQTATPFATLAFCQQIEIGTPCQIAEFITGTVGRSSDGVELIPVSLDNPDYEAIYPRFRPPPTTPFMKLTASVDLGGTRDQLYWEGAVSAMSIRNFPKHGDRGPMADPELPSLDVWINDLDRRGRRLADTGDHYRAEFLRTEDKMEIVSSKEEFKVLIDGDVFPPVVRLVIKPFLKPKGSVPASAPVTERQMDIKLMAFSEVMSGSI